MQKFTKSVTLITALFTSNILLAQQDTSKGKSLEEVIITGQYKPQSLKNSVYQVRVINNQRIALSGATNIQQVLNNQLGFRFSNDNTLGITDAQLNGMGGNNVKILLDGVPMTDRYDQRVSLSQIDINNVERIEIVEGPMSVSFGSDAMAGVINIITKKNNRNNLSITAKAQEETAGNEYHTFNYKGVHNQNVNINFKQDHFILSGGGSHNDFDGFGGDAYGRGKSWKPKEQWLGNFKLGYTSSNFNIYYRLDAVNEITKSRGAINYRTYQALDQKYTTDRYLHQIQSDYRFNKNLQWNGFIAFTDYTRTTKTSQHDFEKGLDSLIVGQTAADVSKLKSFTFKNTFQYQISSKVSLQSGLDINHEKASGERIIGSPEINDYALFVSAEIKPTGKINIRPGLRFDKNSQYDAPPVIPSINTKFTLNKNFDLRLAYGYGFRAPTLRELYLTFVDVNHNLAGNPDLKAEKSNSINGSLNWIPTVAKDVTFSTTLSGFYNDFRNQIQLIQSRTDSAQYTYYNIDKSKTVGGSIDNRATYKNWNASLGFSYLGYSSSQYDDKSYVKQDSRNFLWSPEVNAGIIYSAPRIKTSFGLFYKYMGKKPAFSEGTIGTQKAFILTQTLGYSFADFTITNNVNRLITASAGVKNIFDVTNVNSNTVVSSATAHSTSGSQALGYGRSYFAGLVFHWNKK